MENLAWVPILKIEPDGEEDCLCIAVSHTSRLYVTEGGVVTHNTTVDGEGAGVLNAGDGNFRRAISDGLPPGEVSGLDRSEWTGRARGLLAEFAQGAEALSASHDGPQRMHSPDATAQQRTSVAVEYSGDGSLTVTGLSGAVWDNLLAEDNGNPAPAMSRLKAVIAEETWHLAQLAAMRQDWLALPAATRGSFVSHVEQASESMLADIRRHVTAMGEQGRRSVQDAFANAWALYFNNGQPVPDWSRAMLFDAITAPGSAVVSKPAFVAELLRQLQQAQREGQTTETAGLIARLVEWVKAALANFRRVAGMAQRGELGAETQRLMEQMAAIVDGREAVPPFRAKPSRFSGDSGTFNANLGTTYRTLPNAVMELQEGMEWARSTREERTVDGEPVPATAYDVRTDIAMREASEAVMDSLAAEGLRGDALMAALRSRNLGGARLEMDERQILLRHMIQTGRFHELGVTRRQLMTLMQEGAGKGAMAMREMREAMDPIERLRQEAEARTNEEVRRVTGQDAGALHGEMEREVLAAQETAVNAELEKLRAEASELRQALDQHKADLAETRQNATKERLQREAEVKRLQNLLKLAEAKVAELEARPADSAEANERLAEQLLKARERAAELREKLAEAEAKVREEREVGIAIGREEGRAEAEAEAAARQPEAQLERFEQWLMGNRFAPGLEGLPTVETFARRFLQASRFDAAGFSQAVMALFPAVDPHIVEDAMDRVAVSLANSAAAARKRQIAEFIDRLAGRVKKPQDQERLGRFLGSLERASDFGILDADVFSDAFAHAFELNGMNPAVAQRLLDMWHEINRLDEDGNRVHFGMVRETLEREFLQAVNAVAPGARWDNFIFNQYQSAVLSSISSGMNQFSGIFRALVGIDAVARLAARGNYNPADVVAEWWRNVSDLFSNLPLVLTGLRGESLGHMGPQVRGNFTPQEQQLQWARGHSMRMRLPGGRTVTLPDSAARLLRLKELWSWRIIRAAEGLSGVTDAQARFRDTLASHYQAQGMSASQARARALSDIAASPADKQAAEAQARAEQAAGRIGKGETVVRRRMEEIIQNRIDRRLGEELTARAEHLTAAAQFKTMPTGAIGYAIASTFKAMTNASEGGGRLARFFFLFGRFMGHTVDVTLGYVPGLHYATLGRESGTTRRHEVIKEVYGSVEAYNDQQRGKAVAGTSFLLATAALQALAAALGDDDEEPWFNVTGFAPMADPAAKERLKATGQWDEGQIRIGGRPVFNYSQLPELVPLLTILGNISDYLRFDRALFRRASEEGEDAGGQPMTAGGVAGAVAGDVLLAPLKRSTYKQWVAALDGIMKGRPGDAGWNIATSPLGGALRVPLLVDADKIAREADGARDAKGLVENTLRRVPFVLVGEKMFNPYGEQLPGFDTIGMFPSGPKASPEVQAAARLNLETRTTRGVPQLNLKYADNTVREATAEEREAYIATSGRYFVESLLRNEEAIRRAYETGGQAAAQKIVGNISRKANEQAKAETIK